MNKEDALQFDATRPICIVGLGVMGARVAWACANAGLVTHGYDLSRDNAAKAVDSAIEWSAESTRERIASLLKVHDTLEEAVAGCQLVFENVPEVLEVKNTVLRQIDALLPPNACIGSNTSSFLCSTLANAIRHPQRLFAMNFTDPRKMRLVELMGGALTSAETLQFARAWAHAIGMLPAQVRREQMGYCFNRLWREIKKEVLRQIANGYCTAEDIDRAWMLAWGTRYGPCGLMDETGLDSILNVEKSYFAATGGESDRPPKFLEDMVAANKKGVSTGQGFFTYPDPVFLQPGFLEKDGESS